MKFIAPSHLDYSAYCNTRLRDGIESNSVASAMACVQEANEWKRTGYYEIVTSETLIGNEPANTVDVSKVRVSVKQAIHAHSFLICEFSHGSVLVACGYDKENILLCHPDDIGRGTYGKMLVRWKDFESQIVRIWYSI